MAGPLGEAPGATVVLAVGRGLALLAPTLTFTSAEVRRLAATEVVASP